MASSDEEHDDRTDDADGAPETSTTDAEGGEEAGEGDQAGDDQPAGERGDEDAGGGERTEESDDDDEEADDDDEEADDDDEEADDDGEPAPKARSKAKRKGGMTPGERLAAAKARKARLKKTKRGRDAEVVETKVLKKADAAGDWIRENKRGLWGALAIVLVVGLGLGYWQYSEGQKEQAASELLWSAVQASRAELRPEGTVVDAAQDDGRETFPDALARAETALDRYRDVLEQYPGTNAAIWARLGEANSLMALERADDARESFQAALGEAGDDPMVVWRALEGIAFTYESQEQWDEAIDRFQQLSEEGGSFRDIADYHVARMHLAKDDEVRAKELLQGLIERLRGGADEDQDDDRPELGYVLSQAEIRLMEIDSSLVQARPTPGFGGGGLQGIGGGGGDDGEQMSPEQMQKILEMLQKQGFDGQGAGGAPEGRE